VTDIENPIKISGHTDNVPIHTLKYPSNWELSSDRSNAVLHFMLQNKKLLPTRFSAAGFGEYKPIADNKSEAGRSKNRRVEILVERMNQEGLLVPDKK
jgi:chemotaxis protein MotB